VLIVRAIIIIPRFPTYGMWSCIVMLVIHQRYRRTDGRTDRQTDDMQLQDCALHYSISHGKTDEILVSQILSVLPILYYYRYYWLTQHWMTVPTTTRNDNT